MKILGNRILIEIDKVEDFEVQVQRAKQTGGVVIPPRIVSRPSEGIIRQLGTGRDIPPELQVGQRVRVDVNMGSVPAGEDLRMRIYSWMDILLILDYQEAA